MAARRKFGIAEEILAPPPPPRQKPQATDLHSVYFVVIYPAYGLYFKAYNKRYFINRGKLLINKACGERLHA